MEKADIQMLKNDIIREFELDHDRCERYFDRMYRILQFTFVAVIAGIVFAFDEKTMENLMILTMMFGYILPSVFYISGVLFAYCAYALSVYGKRATVLKKNIYPDIFCSEKNKYSLEYILKNYVGLKRSVALISYGVPLFLYILTPLTSIGVCIYIVGTRGETTLLELFSVVPLLIYFLFMVIIIIQIVKNYSIK